MKRHHKLLPKVTDNLLTWDDAIEILGCYCGKGLLNLASEKPPTKEYSDYFYTQQLAYLNDNIPHKVEHVYKTLDIEEDNQQYIKKKHTPNIALYMSLAPNAFSHGIHRDVTDVYHWQQLGTTKWVVYDNGKHTYDLTPGDILFIPKGMYHDTLPLSPRVGISVGWFPPEHEYKGEEGMTAVDSYLQRNNLDTVKPDDNSMQSQIFRL